LTRTIKASGQGITPDFRYTGDYDSVVEFGAVTLDLALGLIGALSPFSREASDAGLCPPSVLLVDSSGNALTVSRSVEGGFNVYFSGSYSGGVLHNASLSEVEIVVTQFFSGVYPKVTDYAKTVGKRSSLIGIDLLAYMPLYEYHDPFDVGSEHEIAFYVWREEEKRTYVEVDEEGGGKTRVPLSYVTEIILRSGGFLRSAKLEIRFTRKDGSSGRIVKRIDGKNRGWIPKVFKKLSKILPGKVKVE